MKHILVAMALARGSIQSVLCNDKPWTQFDKDKEWLILPGALDSTQRFTIQY